MSDDNKPESEDVKSKPDVKSDEAKHINLKVVGQDSDTVIHFKIRRNTQLKKLMQAYCQQTGLDISVLRFTFDGTRLGPESTPLEHEMEDDDTIEVFWERIGGTLT